MQNYLTILKKKKLAQTNLREELAEEIQELAEGIKNLEGAELAGEIKRRDEVIEKRDEENKNRIMDALKI